MNKILRALVLLAALPSMAFAQEIPQEDYLRYSPLSYPRLVPGNDPTAALHLFGDRSHPDYRDENPVDGIDDDRARILKDLAVRFAPYLVQNTTDIPTNFFAYIENRKSFPLFVDTWDISAEHPLLLTSEEIDFSDLGVACEDPGSPGAADCRLLDLLRDLSPQEPREPALNSPLVRVKPDLFRTLYFNFPGAGPGSWEEAYRGEYEATPQERKNSFPHAYVHPFLEEVKDSTGTSQGYELVLQYWFFYPSNDGGNNHEGDWEHLNVLIAPRSRVESPLSGETVERILSGDLSPAKDAADPLVIRRLDYYFHHFVMTLDFTRPNVYMEREAWKDEMARLPEERFQQKELWRAIRTLAYRDKEETEVNTHPVGYIGADNKGFDQVLSMPGGNNRNSHGTFPFTGRYQNIGPGGATEEISVNVQPRRYWKRLDSGEVTSGPEWKRGRLIGLDDPERLTVVPDWELVLEPVLSDARARRDWSWLVLPIRWGYPATTSPFAGILSHIDTGNLAPVGPSFSPGWNTTGSSSGFHAYDPHTLPDVFPLRFQDGFRNDLGFLNLTTPVLFNLPPLDFATRIASYPVKRLISGGNPVFYPRDGIPFRFVGLSSGVSRQSFSEDWDALSLNRGQLDEFTARLLLHFITNGFDSTTTVTSAEEFKDTSVRPFYQLAFYIGGRFVSENTVRNARATYGIRATFSNIPPYEYTADINYWEYAGSLRYNVLPTRLQPFLKVGYGWSWYRLENVQVNDIPFDPPDSDWFSPGILPNVLHYGLGVEFVPWRSIGKLPGGLEVAFRLEYGRYMQSLGLDLSDVPLENLRLLFQNLGDIPTATRVHRHDLLFGLSLTF